MPRASAADAELTRQRVLAAAIDHFALRGFGGASLDEIASAASVTRGAIYHHFTSKAGLFRAVLSDQQAQVAADIENAVNDSSADPQVKLRVGCHAFLDAITQPPRSQILLVEAPSAVGWQTWRDLDSENSGALLRAGLLEAGTPLSHIDAMTVQLSGAMNEAALWIADNGHPDVAKSQAHAVLDLLVDAALMDANNA